MTDIRNFALPSPFVKNLDVFPRIVSNFLGQKICYLKYSVHLNILSHAQKDVVVCVPTFAVCSVNSSEREYCCSFFKVD